MKMKEYKGRYVSLKHRMETQGGSVYAAGEIMEVYQTWRGKLSLQRIGLLPNGCVDVIRQVSTWEVELLPADPERIVVQALNGALDLAKQFGFGVRFRSFALTKDVIRVVKKKT